MDFRDRLERMSGYMVREEMQRELLRGKAGMRTMGYKRKLKKGEGSEVGVSAERR